jgi:hypothetical protein
MKKWPESQKKLALALLQNRADTPSAANGCFKSRMDKSRGWTIFQSGSGKITAVLPLSTDKYHIQ